MLPPEMMGGQDPMAGAGGQDPMAAIAGLMGGQGPAPTGPGGQAGGSTVDILRQMLDLGKQYLDVEQDEEDILTMTKVLQLLQGYLASEQKEQQDAMQGKLSPKLLAQSYGA